MSARTAITIGAFDGVHIGHVQLVRTARAAVGDDGRVVVLSFDPHPATVLSPTRAPARLSTFDQRVSRLTEVGADEIVRLEPTSDLLALTPDAFLENIASRFEPDVIIEGPDFHFGRGRSGTVETIRAHQERLGYRTVVIDPVEVRLVDHRTARASSTLARWLVAQGRMRDVRRTLDRPYEIVAKIVPGNRRGQTINVPTANLEALDWAMPADGIYAGSACRPDGHTFPAAISVGTKPTFGAFPRTCEAHLIGYDGPVEDYGWTIRLSFLEWLRDQIAYDSVDALLEQIRDDLRKTEEACAAVAV